MSKRRDQEIKRIMQNKDILLRILNDVYKPDDMQEFLCHMQRCGFNLMEESILDTMKLDYFVCDPEKGMKI